MFLPSHNIVSFYLYNRMRFQKWLEFREGTLPELYSNTVKAFPRTTKRQHSQDLIKIAEISWFPFLGVKTLFVRGLAQSDSGKEYRPMILFKGVEYEPHDNVVEITANDGKQYAFEQLTGQTDVLVRCDCKDFGFRFNFYDAENGFLYGKVRKKYEAHTNPGSANPLELPGMCKHILKLVKSLEHAGVLEAL